MNKYVKIALAFILTAAMLVVTRMNSRGTAEYVEGTDKGFEFAITTVPKITEGESDRVTVHITPADAGEYVYVMRVADMQSEDETNLAGYRSLPLELQDGSDATHGVQVTAGERGGKLFYYFEVLDSDGNQVAVFKTDESAPFVLRYIGEVPLTILIPHIFFIFANFFCVSFATLSAFEVMGGKRGATTMMKAVFWALVFTFIAGYPFGIAMNWYAFGGTWEGVPFGTDATDNKTQLLLFYLLFVVLFGWKSKTGGKSGRDLLTSRGLSWLVLSSFAFMMFIFLIPHSIQFSPALTYGFCYGVTGLLALIYLLARMKVGSISQPG